MIISCLQLVFLGKLNEEDLENCEREEGAKGVMGRLKERGIETPFTPFTLS